MGILQELKSEYGYDTPIFLKEVKVKGMTDVGIRQTLTRLTQRGGLERYAQGVYYIPQMTPFGKSKLSAKKVYELKYITNNKEIYGYYSGLILENTLGLTTQMPNIIEIVTNNESSRVREVQIGTQKLRLRRSKVKITAKNVRTLQFLDLLSRKTWKTFSDNEKKQIINYAREQGLRNEDIYIYISYYPSCVAKNILESRLTDELSR